MGTHSSEGRKQRAMVDQPVRVVAAACDGACRGNPGPGGWGALLRFENGQTRELGGFDPATTNNRMELTAALALFVELRELPRHPELVIRTDSRYLIDGLQSWLAGWKRRGWRTASGGPVLNQELWQQLDAARLPGLRLVHVRGHSGDPDNDRCDAIAVAFAQGQTPRLAAGGPGPVTPAGNDVGDLGGGSGDGPKAPPRSTASSRTRPAARGTPREALAAGAQAPGSMSAASGQRQRIAAEGAVSSAGPAAALGSPDEPEAGADPADSRTSAGRSQESDKTVATLELDAAKPPAATTSADTRSAAITSAAPEQGPAPQDSAAPPGLNRLLSRLELADRLAAGGYGLSLVELAQLVELPLRRLEERQSAWTWRDWRVEPLADGRWRLERDAGGLEKRSPG